jgi:hypothetical protein
MVLKCDVNINFCFSYNTFYFRWKLATVSSDYASWTCRDKEKLRIMPSSGMLRRVAWWFLSLWWWRRDFPPKCRFLQEPHGIRSQKTAFFIATAVKTSNHTENRIVLEIAGFMERRHGLFSCWHFLQRHPLSYGQIFCSFHLRCTKNYFVYFSSLTSCVLLFH